MKREIFFFLIIGTIGFMLDAGIVYILTEWALSDPILARIPAILIAIGVTFALNRAFTFKDGRERSLPKAFVKYISANGVSQGLNFGIYSLLVLFVAFLAQNPVIALAIGSICAMGVTFILSKFWVFQSVSTSELPPE